MKRVSALSLLALILLLARCDGPGEDASQGNGSGGAPYAGIVFDVGGIDDKSFNELAHRGLKKAESDLGVTVEMYEPAQPADPSPGLQRLCNKKCQVVIGVGFIFSDQMVERAKEFPEIRFGCIDMNQMPADQIPSNLVGLRFREHEGAFLVGAIAGLTTKSKKVGFVGGMNVPLIHKFEAGFKAGVKHVAPDVEVFVDYAGETPEAFRDPEK